MQPEAIQESQYSFPYHHLPHQQGMAWQIYRMLPWGYEYLALLETITSIVSRYKPASVLDFGCGDGRMVYELSHLGIDKVVGVDISERAVYFARALVQSPGVSFHTSLDNVSEGQMELIVTVEVLEHIPDEALPGVFQDLHRVLSDDGVLVVSVPTTNQPLNPKHYRHYTLGLLTEQTQDLFDVQHVEYVGKIGFVGKMTKKMLSNGFVIPSWRPWLKMTTNLYRRYAMQADASTGAHLIAVLAKRGNGLPRGGG